MADTGPAYRARAIPDLGRFWTGANVLTLIRLVLIFPIAYLVLINGPIMWIFGLAIVAILTDWFDGRVARWSRTESEWGRVLDPLADKLGAALVALALVLRGSLPVWFLSVLVARDVLIVIGGYFLARRTGTVVESMPSGKWALGALAITILAALLEADPPIMVVCLTVTTILLVYSFLRYAIRFVYRWREHPPASRSGASSTGGSGHEIEARSHEPTAAGSLEARQRQESP